MLRDGQWHLLEEIRQKMKLDGDQMKQIAAFLKEYEFIAIDETKREMRLEETVRKFLA
jgi:hypothetical protein